MLLREAQLTSLKVAEGLGHAHLHAQVVVRQLQQLRNLGRTRPRPLDESGGNTEVQERRHDLQRQVLLVVKVCVWDKGSLQNKQCWPINIVSHLQEMRGAQDPADEIFPPLFGRGSRLLKPPKVNDGEA